MDRAARRLHAETGGVRVFHHRHHHNNDVLIHATEQIPNHPELSSFREARKRPPILQVPRRHQ